MSHLYGVRNKAKTHWFVGQTVLHQWLGPKKENFVGWQLPNPILWSFLHTADQEVHPPQSRFSQVYWWRGGGLLQRSRRIGHLRKGRHISWRSANQISTEEGEHMWEGWETGEHWLLQDRAKVLSVLERHHFTVRVCSCGREAREWRTKICDPFCARRSLQRMKESSCEHFLNSVILVDPYFPRYFCSWLLRALVWGCAASVHSKATNY